MRVRESGMPSRDLWESFFEPAAILGRLGLDASVGDVVEFGCGYGTFALPAAKIVSGTVHALDLDPAMLAVARERAASAGLRNIRFWQRDFLAEGSGLPDESVDFAMLFNILHGEEPLSLLREAYRNLVKHGRLGIIHWNYDEDTPRGPPMNVRPKPEQCHQWALDAGFTAASGILDLPPYHYGMVMCR